MPPPPAAEAQVEAQAEAAIEAEIEAQPESAEAQPAPAEAQPESSPEPAEAQPEPACPTVGANANVYSLHGLWMTFTWSTVCCAGVYVARYCEWRRPCFSVALKSRQPLPPSLSLSSAASANATIFDAAAASEMAAVRQQIEGLKEQMRQMQEAIAQR